MDGVLNMHKLTMISGVAPCNNQVIGAFVHPEYAKLIGDYLLRRDREDHPEWSRYIIEPVPAVDCLRMPAAARQHDSAREAAPCPPSL